MNRKNLKKRWSCAILAVALALTMTACGGKLNGTYKSTEIISQTITFDGDKVTLSAFGLNVSGTYKATGDVITVFYTLLGSEHSLDLRYEKSGKNLSIEGVDFVKQ